MTTGFYPAEAFTGCVIDMTGLDRLIAFDKKTGVGADRGGPIQYAPGL